MEIGSVYMPEKRIIEPFVPREDFDENLYIKERIRKVNEYLLEELDSAYEINNGSYKIMCMMAVIDCLAQEYANYPKRDTQKCFVDFVLQFQSMCAYLNQIEPVTLYYDYEPNIQKIISNPELKDEFSSFGDSQYEIFLDESLVYDGQLVSKVINSGKAAEILAIIKRDKGEKELNKYTKSHRFINLIYKMRSKAVHELSSLGCENKWEKEDGNTEPFYRDMSRLYKNNDFIVSDNVFELVIPSIFIYNLAKNVINNYSKYCMENKRLPFENNSNFKRPVDITWRD